MKKLLFFITLIGLFGTTQAQTNMITNGSFENDFWPTRQPGTYIFGRDIAYSEPARVAEYFDLETKPYWPKIDDATTPVFNVESGVWYLRNSGNYNYVRLYVDALKPLPADGNKCLTFHNTKYYGTATRNQQALIPFQHVGFQRVKLDNSKKYLLSFSYMKMDSLIGATSGTTTNYKTENYATRFVAGVVSATELSVPLDYSYVVDIPIPVLGDEMWKDTAIVLDLPALITEKSNLDFDLSAIIFGLQTQEDIESTSTYTMMPGQMSIDNIKLVEYIESDVTDLINSRKINIVDRRLYVLESVNSLQIFSLMGSKIYEKINLSPGTIDDVFMNPGFYLIKTDGIIRKVLVK